MPLIVDGWTLLFHDMMIGQLERLADASARALAAAPGEFGTNANVRLLSAIAKIVLRTVPRGPGAQDYRIGNTMGPGYRHWSRVKFGGRFRLFFRYDSASRIIVYAWVNDERTLRSSGGRNDPYVVFRAMLDRGNPPDAWRDLVTAATDLSDDLLVTLKAGSDS